MKTVLIFTFMALGIIGCSKHATDLTAQCSDTGDTSNYQILQSGDVISKKASSAEPEIKIIHTEDGLKKACIKSGAAVITK